MAIGMSYGTAKPGAVSECTQTPNATFFFISIAATLAYSSPLMKKIKVAQFGLGPIGVESLRLAASKPWADIVGAVDIDPAKVGRQLSEVTGLRSLRGRIVHGSLGELLGTETPEVIFHTAVSRFKAAFEQLEPMARKGINVVSSCEELVFPQLREPALARRLDRFVERKARASSAPVLIPGL